MEIFILSFLLLNLFTKGGWLLVTNITSSEVGQSASIATYFAQNQGSILDLSDVTNGKYRFDANKFASLHDHLPFTEVRIFCRKIFHNRVFHAVLSSAKLINYVTQTDISSFNYCENRIRFLDDDTSLMSSENCANVISKRHYNIYNHFIYVSVKYHVTATSNGIFTCDDRSTDNGYTNEGTWQYFVR